MAQPEIERAREILELLIPKLPTREHQIGEWRFTLSPYSPSFNYRREPDRVGEVHFQLGAYNRDPQNLSSVRLGTPESVWSLEEQTLDWRPTNVPAHYPQVRRRWRFDRLGRPGVLEFLRVDLAGDTLAVYELRKTDLLPRLVYKKGQPELTDNLPVSLASVETIGGQPVELHLVDYEQRAKQIVDLLAAFAEEIGY